MNELRDLILKILPRISSIKIELQDSAIRIKTEDTLSKEETDTSEMNGMQLRYLRKEFGLTQHELADRARCNVKSIIRLEKGGIPKKSTILTNIKKVFDEITESYTYQSAQS